MSSFKCNVLPKIVLSFVVLVTVIVCNVSAFNLSPKPNLVLAEPKLETYIPKARSSYFGFSVNLRKNSVMVGAPRAQTTLASQRAINESGAIFKCSLTSAKCEPFIFDSLGNTNYESDEYTHKNEKKDNQWLGAAIDGNGLETDRFVVCAPRMIGVYASHYLMHGICYWTSNTTNSKPLNVKKIAPLRLKSKQYISGDSLEKHYYHMYGEQGLSVHITENNEEILIGAPGIYSWKGSVIRYQAVMQDAENGLSRRDDTGALHSIRKRELEYVSDVPNPSIWKQEDNSYFGYAVSSGFFGGPQTSKLLYVASAPQANNQQGEVYLFDIIADDHSSDKTIKIYHTFASKQMGEYFGYALVSEDFNEDGFTDIAIAAPFHSRGGASFENGAVHIYRNIDGKSFELHSTLRSEYELNGRFGTTISRIGDINNDGYKDLAVGAPYENHGAVYIFLGSANGLLAKASQRIAAPSSNSHTDPSVAPAHMFGYGVSKGVDIDGNNYLDIAIGAPDAEAVYVYKAYPVVRFVARIVPGSREIKTTDTSMKLKACWSLSSKYEIQQDTRFKIEIKLDPQHGRVKFSDDPTSNTKELNVTAGENEECLHFDANVKFSIADIFKPIDLNMNYVVLDGIPDSEDFCTTCVAINPNDPKVITNKVVFNTGCASNRCVANLKLTSTIFNPVPYILGSSKSIIIDYKIENLAETAYLTQLNISIPDSVSFLKIPSVCRLQAESNNDLLCDINGGSPLYNNSSAYFKLTLDTTKLYGNHLLIKAHVLSTGDESNEMDNSYSNMIYLAEFSDIEITGRSTKPVLSLEDGIRLENISHTFEIRNNGPSTIKNLDVLLSIPVFYLNPWNMQRVEVIDFENVTVNCTYEDQFYDVEWSQNNTVLIQGAFESSSLPIFIADSNMNGMSFDAAHLGMEYDLNAGSINDLSNPDNNIGQRRRRELETAVTQNSVNYRNYNKYTQSVLEYQAISRRRIDLLKGDSILSNLPVNRTILFDCYDADAGLCIKARFSVNNFRTGNSPIYITLNFTVDLSRVDRIVTEKQDIFVLISSAQILKTDDVDGMTVNVVQTHPYSIISKYHVQGTPIWVWVVSVIGGLLTLILITYGLYRAGFFKREKKEELEQFKRQSQALALHQGTDNIDN